MTQITEAAQALFDKTDERVRAGSITYRHGENIRRGIRSWIDLRADGCRFGDLECDGISGVDIEERFLPQLNGSPKTVRSKLDSLKLLFDVACRNGWAGHNPARGVKIETARYGDAAEKKPRKRFDIGEGRRLIGAALAAESIVGNVPWCEGLAVSTAAQTGLRFGEMAALRWADIDFSKKRVTVHRSLRKVSAVIVAAGAPKTDAARRTVFLTPQLTNELREWRLRSPASDDGDTVFLTRNGRAHTNSDHWRKRVLRPACAAVGIEPLRWHDLRHFYASVLLEMFGSDFNRITTLMGHKSINTTRELYGHWIDDPERDENDASEFGKKLWG